MKPCKGRGRCCSWLSLCPGSSPFHGGPAQTSCGAEDAGVEPALLGLSTLDKHLPVRNTTQKVFKRYGAPQTHALVWQMQRLSANCVLAT